MCLIQEHYSINRAKPVRINNKPKRIYIQEKEFTLVRTNIFQLITKST